MAIPLNHITTAQTHERPPVSVSSVGDDDADSLTHLEEDLAAISPRHRSTFFDNPRDLEPDRTRSPLKRTMYDLLENPTSSSSAFLIHVFCTSLIVVSAFITILETLPPFHSTPSQVWFGLETALVVCFTVEYMCRLFAHSETWSSFWAWFGSFFAIVDLLAILPYYIEIAVQADTTAFFRFSILRTFRLLRVFRPFRYSNTILLTIEVMYLSMKRSKDALLALGFFVLMAVVVFSTLLYFAERGKWDDTLETFVDADGDPTQFESIPAAAWFVLVTITTVGYGEMIPRSFLGRLITLPLLICGLLLIALPSFVLGREFATVWEGMSTRSGNTLPLRARADSLGESIDSRSSYRVPDPERGNPSSLPDAFQRPNPRSRTRHAHFAVDPNVASSDVQVEERISNQQLALDQEVLRKQIQELTALLHDVRGELVARRRNE